MPIRSRAQLRWLAANKSKIGGEQGFEEWAAATPSIKSLPEKVKPKGKKKNGKR